MSKFNRLIGEVLKIKESCRTSFILTHEVSGKDYHTTTLYTMLDGKYIMLTSSDVLSSRVTVKCYYKGSPVVKPDDLTLTAEGDYIRRFMSDDCGELIVGNMYYVKSNLLNTLLVDSSNDSYIYTTRDVCFKHTDDSIVPITDKWESHFGHIAFKLLQTSPSIILEAPRDVVCYETRRLVHDNQPKVENGIYSLSYSKYDRQLFVLTDSKERVYIVKNIYTFYAGKLVKLTNEDILYDRAEVVISNTESCFVNSRCVKKLTKSGDLIRRFIDYEFSHMNVFKDYYIYINSSKSAIVVDTCGNGNTINGAFHLISDCNNPDDYLIMNYSVLDSNTLYTLISKEYDKDNKITIYTFIKKFSDSNNLRPVSNIDLKILDYMSSILDCDEYHKVVYLTYLCLESVDGLDTILDVQKSIESLLLHFVKSKVQEPKELAKRIYIIHELCSSKTAAFMEKALCLYEYKGPAISRVTYDSFKKIFVFLLPGDNLLEGYINNLNKGDFNL